VVPQSAPPLVDNSEKMEDTMLNDSLLSDPEDEEDSQAGAGTILEAAFVDPAYSWPPAEGMGKNAVELEATQKLLEIDDNASIHTTDSEKARMRAPDPPMYKVTTTTETVSTSRCGFLKCCKQEDATLSQAFTDGPGANNKSLKAEHEAKKKSARNARKAYKARKRSSRKGKERSRREREKYARVPEGIFIYRLNTRDHSIQLMTEPSSLTDRDTLLTEMVIAGAFPSNDKSRRGIDLVGVDGSNATIVACDQRTAIAWLEGIDMMLGNKSRNKLGKKISGREWSKEKLSETERNQIEEHYLNLAAYSNKLIRTGGIPGQEGKKKDTTGGIYYSIDTQREDADDVDEEALESIAKRRAVIKDSWDFYRMICSLLRDRRKYDEVFRKMQLDPVYPYLNSMTGLNDPGDDGSDLSDKIIMQPEQPEYASMSKSQVCQALVKKAEKALPSLVEICKAMAGSLGMEEVGVGPIKEVSAAIRKAEKKYEGDVLKCTDYCRSLLVVKDFATLLALLELARDSFGPLIRRVKLSTLKDDHKSLPGGYRDCKINLELKDHICEIQIHIWPMWVVCGIDGFRHYRHCLEYKTDTFENPYDALVGLERKTMAELLVMAEEAVSDMPLDNIEWYHEKYILDYFAEVGLFLKHGLDVFAEITLRQLIALRCDSPDIGPDHHETWHLQKYLEQALRSQEKIEEADELKLKIEEFEKSKSKEKTAADMSLWDSWFGADVMDSLMDPNKKEREEEEKLKKDIKASKRAWRKIREERFQFLDANAESESKAEEGEGPKDY